MIIQRRWEIRNFNGFANQRARLMRIISTDKKRVLAAKLRENRNDSDSCMNVALFLAATFKRRVFSFSSVWNVKKYGK